jgi:hypothetical protein
MTNRIKSSDQVSKVMQSMREGVFNLVATAVKEERDAKWILDQMEKRVYGRADWTRLPAYAQGEIVAFYQGMCRLVDTFQLVSGYMYEGVLYATPLTWSAAIRPHHEKWDVLQDKHHAKFGRFIVEECDSHGLYWPSGKPFHITVPTTFKSLAEAA